MFEKRGASLRNARLEIRFLLPLGEFIAFEKRHGFFQHGHVAGGFDELNDGVRQPQQIVGHARANAASGRRMPPVLHVAFHELVRGRTQQMLAGDRSLGNGQRHHSCS